MVTSKFRGSIGGCGYRSAFPSVPGHAGVFGAFQITSVLYSNDLPSEAPSFTLSISSLS